MAHSLKHLDEAYKTICDLTLEEQSDYADEVCIKNVNKKFLINSCKNIDLYKENFTVYNTTSIGNLAYIILHCKDKEAVDVCRELLLRYEDYMNEGWDIWN